MKLKSLVIAGTSALFSAAILPAATAQQSDNAVNGQVTAIDVRPDHAGGPARHRPRPDRNVERLFDHIDADTDGFVDIDEFLDVRLARLDRKFDRRDIDGDGLISEEEADRRRHHDRPIDREAVIQCVRDFVSDWEAEHDEAVEDRFYEVDLNGDGYLDFTELSIALEERATGLFRRIDSDGDGLLSIREVEAFLEYQLNLRRVIRYCIDQVSDPFEATL
jgi:Ca2+-binding EF-hand superfamily protein